MFVSFTLFKLTLDECKTLTKISTHETSHNRSPNQRTLWMTKKQGENPPLKGKQQVIQKRDVCIIGGESAGIRISSRNNGRIKKTTRLVLYNTLHYFVPD